MAIVALFLSAAVVRIVLTYEVFCQTWDEPVHIASGMEWLQQGTYRYEVLHPPLARVAVAIGPYLRGIRLDKSDLHSTSLVAGGNTILDADSDYILNLTLARLGVLPFFLLCAGTLWYWTRKIFDSWTAVAAVGLFTLLPSVLGHAALATTDLPVTATFTLALCAFATWLERSTLKRSVVLGIAVGLAILSKFTVLLFLPTCFGAVLVCWLLGRAADLRGEYHDFKTPLRRLAIAAAICVTVIIAGYRFSFRPVTTPDERPHLLLDHLFGRGGKWHDVAYRFVETTPVPVPEFFKGIAQAISRSSSPTDMYLLGHVRTRGWWYFFPVTLLVKTPIAFLIFVVVGTVGIVRRKERSGRDWQMLVPFAGALLLLLVCLPTKFNIGLRHILPIYPLLSMVAAFGLAELLRRGRARRLRYILACGLATWLVISSAGAQPDNVAYFNELAWKHPERILLDSDLDWGQDLFRLSKALRVRGITHIAIAYNGSADLRKMNLPPYENLNPCAPTAGWVAISILKLEMSRPSIGCDGYSWLKMYKPVAVIGKSIWLYWIPNVGKARDLVDASKQGEIEESLWPKSILSAE
jgi:hypothetical protein